MGILDVLAPALCRSVAKEEDWKGAATSSVQLIDVGMSVMRLLFEGHPAPKEKKEQPLVRIGPCTACPALCRGLCRASTSARTLRPAPP